MLVMSNSKSKPRTKCKLMLVYQRIINEMFDKSLTFLWQYYQNAHCIPVPDKLSDSTYPHTHLEKTTIKMLFVIKHKVHTKHYLNI